MRATLLDAGTIVLVLLGVFTGLTALAVVLSVGPFDASVELSGKIVEWAGAAFFALLTALGIQRGRGDGGNPPPPPPPEGRDDGSQ